MSKIIHGFILKKTTYLEKDLIVTIFSREYSKLFAIGISAKKSKKRNLNLLDYFNYLKFTIHSKKSYPIYILERVDLIDTFKPKELKLVHIAFIETLNEIIDCLVYGQEDSNELFSLYFETIKDINKIFYEKLSIFKINSLRAIGLQLNHTKCIICGNDGLFLNYSIEKMGFVCNICKKNSIKISLGTIKSIEFIERSKKNLKLTEETIKDINKIFILNLLHLRNKERIKKILKLENIFKWTLKK